MNEVSLDLTKRIPAYLLEAALFVEKRLHRAGFEAYLVGGSVRDLLIAEKGILNKKISDLDFTTNATPAEVKKVFSRVIPVGEEFGTVLVLFKHIPIEVTTYRTEGKYHDGRRPENIEFGKTLEEDVLRRDFTINGMAYSLSNKTILDYVGGIEDLKNKTIRTIGNPLERFREDGLRPIRGCRIMANLGFSMDPDTEAAIGQSLDVVQKVAPERFYDEWSKTLYMEAKEVYWEALRKTGIFGLFFGEFETLQQNEIRWGHLVDVIQHSRPTNMGVYCAHFFYFELKETSSLVLNNRLTQSSFVRSFFQKNRFPNKYQLLCVELVFSPLLDFLEHSDAADIDAGRLKKILSQIERRFWFDHMRFVKEVIYPGYKKEGDLERYAESMRKVIRLLREITREKAPLYIKDLRIDGNDLKALGFEGKEIGAALKKLLDIVIVEPGKNSPESLKEIAVELKDGK